MEGSLKGAAGSLKFFQETEDRGFEARYGAKRLAPLPSV